MKKNCILVTGSSGFVASDLIPRLNEFEVIGIDITKNNNTNFSLDISSNEIRTLASKINEKFTVVNLAASRFDFGASAEDYYKLNVKCHEKFLNHLLPAKIERFIHISSVASIDGRHIPYNDGLNCDDAYRSTKYLQEKIIYKWALKNNIELIILYPSAVFSPNYRSDTNIGKLQKISKLLPFVPVISIKKSLTFLPDFNKFLIKSINKKIPPGNYLTINKPTITVTEILDALSDGSKIKIKIPFIKEILTLTSNLIFIFSFFGKFDLKLMPNRVLKLFSDTSYENIDNYQIDCDEYIMHSNKNLSDILSTINNDREK